MGDFAWKLGCAFFGSYITISSFIKVAMLPLGFTQFEAFIAFRPEPATVIARAGEHAGTIFGSPFVYGPVLLLIASTAAGTWVQVKLLKREETSDRERLIGR